MSIDSILGSVAKLWARHSPTVVMHVVLFVVLRGWVIDPQHPLLGAPVWGGIKSFAETLRTEAGLNIQLGYVLAALGYVYLTALQWLAEAITRVPGLRISFGRPVDPNLVLYAGGVLRTPPEPRTTQERMQEVVESYVRGFWERGEPEPFAGLETSWSRFYGLSILATGGTIVWLFEGARGAVSHGRVAEFALVALSFTFFARWQLRRRVDERTKRLRYAALYEYERNRSEPPEPDPLIVFRRKLLARGVRWMKAYRRHPAAIIRRWVERLLPRKVTLRMLEHLGYPPIYLLPYDDWQILRSQVGRHADEDVPPPNALSVDGYRERFRSLLECRGAGLCIVVDSRFGLAPSVAGWGSCYCFGTRCHGTDNAALSVEYAYAEDRNGWGEFRLWNCGEEWGFLADVGPHPIERFVQYDFPQERREEEWHKLVGRQLNTSAWSYSQFNGEGSNVAGIRVCSHMPVHLGHTYVLRTRLRTGTEVVIAFQCFGTGEPGRLLLAWKILDVLRDQQTIGDILDNQRESSHILPWWKPHAWQGVVRRPPKPS